MTKLNITEVKRAFNTWRRGNSGKKKVPQELRELAIKASEEYGYSRTSKELGISSSSIWEWRNSSDKVIKRLCPRSGKKKSGKSSNVEVKGMQFVEYPASALIGASKQSLINVEWQRVDGSRMRIEGGLSSQDLNRLASEFLRARGGA